MFAIFNSSTEVQLFLNVFNNQHPSLHFTCEKVSGPSLPFLDVKMTICDGEFDAIVYRKPISTGVLRHFNSIAFLHWKEVLITRLLHRAYYQFIASIFIK